MIKNVKVIDWRMEIVISQPKNKSKIEATDAFSMVSY